MILSMLYALQKRKKKEEKGHSASVCDREKHTMKSWRKESHSAIFGVSSRVSKKHKRRELQPFEVQSMWIDKEKRSENVREWKRKMRHFSLLKLHTRKINWWSSHGVFECYNHGELKYSEEDFTTGFVMRLYLLLEIYLLYIQFIVDSSLA